MAQIKDRVWRREEAGLGGKECAMAAHGGVPLPMGPGARATNAVPELAWWQPGSHPRRTAKLWWQQGCVWVSTRARGRAPCPLLSWGLALYSETSVTLVVTFGCVQDFPL